MGILQKDIRKEIKEGWKVDKIKFKYILKRIEDTQNILDKLTNDTTVSKFWESKEVKKCRYNFNLEQPTGTIYIGIESNQFKGNTEEKRKTLILEYNPNKANPFEYEYLNKLREIELHRREIMLIDMAYDMHIDINDLNYIKRRKNEYECKISHEKLETIYLRKLGTNGTVRIYNKTLEMNGGTNEDLDLDTGEIKNKKYFGDCTRYEIRIKPEKLSKQFNILNPFLIEETTKLHKLEIKSHTSEEQILKKLDEYEGNEYLNLLAVHHNKIEKINKNNRKRYKELYQEIKKSCTSPHKYNETFKNFNTLEIFKTLKTYIDYTSIYKDNSIITSELS